jgi:mannan endo-1,4-beta-mannosidase
MASRGACRCGDGSDAVTAAMTSILRDPTAPTAGFVTTADREFRLDGRPFYFQGTNFRELGFLTRHSEGEVYEGVGYLASRGMRVIRLLGATCRGSGFPGLPMIESASPGATVYNEPALRRLDVALDAARAAGMRVILVLVNYEYFACSMHWWVRQVRGGGEPEDFYRDPLVAEVFKRHVETLLTRLNTATLARTGERIAYRDDPTIMAIEAANEPHTSDLYEQRRGLKPGDLVHAWLADITAHIRAVDRNHLISTGEEGYKTGGRREHRYHWLGDGWKGVDFARNLTLPTVDFATLHFYPDAWNMPPRDLPWAREHFFADRARIAHELGKPIILEETGIDASGRVEKFDYHKDPAGYLRRVFRYANQSGYAGTLVWQALPPGFEPRDYEFGPGTPQFSVVETQARVMNARGRGLLARLMRRFRSG